MILKNGEPDRERETFDLKILLAFKDRFVVLETEQTAQFNRE